MDLHRRQVADTSSRGPHSIVPAPDARSRRIVWLCIAAALLALGIFVARSYVVALVWAGVIAIAAWPIYARFSARLAGTRRYVSPLLFTILTALVLAFPVGVALV